MKNVILLFCVSMISVPLWLDAGQLYKSLHLPQVIADNFSVPAMRHCPPVIKAVRLKRHQIDYDYDVTKRSTLIASVVDRKLTGALAHKANLIIDQCKQNDIDPLFVIAVLIHESNNGRSYLSTHNNNVAGIYDGKHKCYAKFDTVDQCIIKTINMLAGKRYAKGNCRTIAQIQLKYCPVGAANDPKGINGDWRSGVVHWMQTIVNDRVSYYVVN